jgi:hypothetical protein
MLVVRRLTPWPRQVLALLVAAPLIGEVVFGSTPLTRVYNLIFEVGMYGGAAVLVRELVVRRRLGASSLIALGLAYGVFEEGLVLQSLFDRHYPGLDFLGYYGHGAGTSWPWAAFIVPYHAVFSITIPIGLVHLWFPDAAARPWLTRAGVAAVAALFAVGCLDLVLFFTLARRPPPATSAVVLGVTTALVVSVVLLAGWASPGRRHPGPAASSTRPSSMPAPLSNRAARLLGLSAGLSWFIGLRVLLIGDGNNVPAPVVPAIAVALFTLWWATVSRLTGTRHVQPEQWCALFAGALTSSWFMGFLISVVSGGPPVVNLVGHVLVGLVMFAALGRLRRCLRTQPSCGDADSGHANSGDAHGGGPAAVGGPDGAPAPQGARTDVGEPTLPADLPAGGAVDLASADHGITLVVVDSGGGDRAESSAGAAQCTVANRVHGSDPQHGSRG